MCTDTTVKTHQVLAVHIGDAAHKLDTLTYTSEKINGALEKDSSLRVPLKEHVIRAFNRTAVQAKQIQKGLKCIRKRVVAVSFSPFLRTLSAVLFKVSFILRE